MDLTNVPRIGYVRKVNTEYQKQVDKTITYNLEGPLNRVIKDLQEKSKQMIEPFIEIDYAHYDESNQYKLRGWQALTETEIVTTERYLNDRAEKNKISKAKQKQLELQNAIKDITAYRKKYPQLFQDNQC